MINSHLVSDAPVFKLTTFIKCIFSHNYSATTFVFFLPWSPDVHQRSTNSIITHWHLGWALLWANFKSVGIYSHNLLLCCLPLFREHRNVLSGKLWTSIERLKKPLRIVPTQSLLTTTTIQKLAQSMLNFLRERLFWSIFMARYIHKGYLIHLSYVLFRGTYLRCRYPCG